MTYRAFGTHDGEFPAASYDAWRTADGYDYYHDPEGPDEDAESEDDELLDLWPDAGDEPDEEYGR